MEKRIVKLNSSLVVFQWVFSVENEWDEPGNVFSINIMLIINGLGVLESFGKVLFFFFINTILAKLNAVHDLEDAKKNLISFRLAQEI